MPTNRELLIAQKKREKGLPDFITNFLSTKKKPFSTKVNRPTPKKTGIQTRGLEGRVEPVEPVDLGLATEGIKEIATPLKKRFTGLEPEGEERFTNTFQGKPIPEVVGMPSNVSIPPKRITRPSAAGVSSFGLPTDRMPSFAELGGAIGQMFKFVGGLTKKREALGLIPGKIAKTTQNGLSLTQKDRATILAKRLDDITLTDTERTTIKSELDKILNPEAEADRKAILES